MDFLVMILKAGLYLHPLFLVFCEGDEMSFLPLLVVSVKDTPPLVCQPGLLYLFVGSGMLHTLAEGLRASEARWAGQAVVAGVCVLTPVLSVVAEAGIRH